MRFEAKIVVKKDNGISYSRILGMRGNRKRSSTSLSESKDAPEIKISAADATALRASLNTMARSLQVVDSVLKADFRKSVQNRKR
jgi:tRNA threonylcarbamoyladenosine modification (KEOPS) complex  Pcc1 subunit